MPRPSIVSLVVALSLSATSFHSQAIGLGSAPDRAVLNRPLDIEMPVIAAEYDLHDIKISLANQAQHDKLGLLFPGWMPKLSFDVRDTASGARVRIRSTLPIKEPVVNFVLKLDYKGNQFLKEVTLLLDPAEMFNAKTLTGASSLGAQRQSQLETITQTQPPKPMVSSKTVFSSGQTIKVSSGQSLWTIAKSWSVAGLSQKDKMRRLFESNRQAFLSNDKNRLQLGANIYFPVEEASNSSLEKTVNKTLAISKKSKATVSLLNDTKIEQVLIQKQANIDSQLIQLNTTIADQRALNAKLKNELARVESLTQKLSQQVSPITMVARTPTRDLSSAISPSLSVSPSGLQSTSSQTNSVVLPIKGNESRSNWVSAVWLAAGMVAFFIFAQFLDKRKVRRFNKKLDRTLEDIAYNDAREITQAPSIKQLAIPTNLSPSLQIKYLSSAAEFYLRCNRYDLAKELVNESLIQFSGNTRIVTALLDIRKNIYQHLDATVQTGIVKKLDTGHVRQPGMLVVSSDDDEFADSNNEAFIRTWNKKVASMR